MAVASRGRTTDQLQLSNKWKHREISPERTKVWTEPHSKLKSERKVPVVYYLSRDGQLEHPHFMEVPISSNEGLYLKDVINRLNSLRGKSMACMYSWSSKRSYKNGFVWHDLCENDFIYPAHGQEYVLKGSELPESLPSIKSQETISSVKSPENHRSGEECDFPMVIRRRNQSWSGLDLHEYKVYKAESAGEYAGKAADAATQTDDKRRRRRTIREEEDEEDEKMTAFEEEEQHTTELNREEISPPPSSSSPETLETLIKANGSIINVSRGIDASDVGDHQSNSSGRMKASTVLMQLISCGSFSVKEKDQGFSLMSHYRTRLPRGAPDQMGSQMGKEVESPMMNPKFGGIQLEDKEYFSGSLIETKKSDFSALKRSSSYNADRSSKMDMKEKEIDGVRAKCMPRRPRMSTTTTTTTKKEIINNSGTEGGSKRFGEEVLK